MQCVSFYHSNEFIKEIYREQNIDAPANYDAEAVYQELNAWEQNNETDDTDSPYVARLTASDVDAMVAKLNPDQRRIYDRVTQSVRNPKDFRYILVLGDGGFGKYTYICCISYNL